MTENKAEAPMKRKYSPRRDPEEIADDRFRKLQRRLALPTQDRDLARSQLTLRLEHYRKVFTMVTRESGRGDVQYVIVLAVVPQSATQLTIGNHEIKPTVVNITEDVAKALGLEVTKPAHGAHVEIVIRSVTLNVGYALAEKLSETLYPGTQLGMAEEAPLFGDKAIGLYWVSL